ncbi:RpiB/LacA/LacB family sugar-phosphate isomerase [Enterococcus alishanensis]|uniref:RpiB/LacA/LacB family sugar-phosphate isomerase n=1 Tax=Enterococcus alishanensis TaxID=1303817 RepID=A0ABS6TEL9_9ENTE|nr:RpiB/LacA/LacB family sugar-phosphate isomerase [Enterococcus alishanensis]MBV7391312.1 RpiB/LacA/LacB family sugar-phosphate isomerase [Enterococcus alishanensis]
MKIGIGSDSNGIAYRDDLLKFVNELGHEAEVVLLQENEDYPDVAVALGKKILNQEFDRGILICGTGIGMAIAANKVPGIRAANITDAYSAERAELSNHAQIITFGQQVLGFNLVKELVKINLGETFVDGRSTPKIERIMTYEKELKNITVSGIN